VLVMGHCAPGIAFAYRELDGSAHTVNDILLVEDGNLLLGRVQVGVNMCVWQPHVLQVGCIPPYEHAMLMRQALQCEHSDTSVRKGGKQKRGDTRMTKGLQPGVAVAYTASIARFSEEHCTSLVLTRRSRPDLQLLLGLLMYPCTH